MHSTADFSEACGLLLRVTSGPHMQIGSRLHATASWMLSLLVLLQVDGSGGVDADDPIGPVLDLLQFRNPSGSPPMTSTTVLTHRDQCVLYSEPENATQIRAAWNFGHTVPTTRPYLVEEPSSAGAFSCQ